jgi:hypothetical protein
MKNYKTDKLWDRVCLINFFSFKSLTINYTLCAYQIGNPKKLLGGFWLFKIPGHLNSKISIEYLKSINFDFSIYMYLDIKLPKMKKKKSPQ